MRSIFKSILKYQLGITCIGLVLAFSANAQLLHRYDETSIITNDTVGTANGTLVGTATITPGGALATYGGNGATNGNWNANGPRMTLDPSAVSGITGPFTIEAWFACSTGWPKYDTVYAFSDNTTLNYILGAPVRGYSPWPSGVGFIGGGGVARADTNIWDFVLSGKWLDGNSGIVQTVLTYDGTTFTYYINGAQADYNGLASTAVDPGFNLSTLTYIGLNGGSPYNDPTLTGTNYDFRIYSQALTADQVAGVYNLGVDAGNAAITALIPEPSTLGLVGIGVLALLALRRKKNS